MEDKSAELLKNNDHGFKEHLLQIYSRHKKHTAAVFFVIGFIFDILTLSRIDEWLSITQQFCYLTVIVVLLHFKVCEINKVWEPKGFILKVWHYQNEILHFLFGSLLSSYTLFYFVSSSFSSSFIFMLIIATLLIANELPYFQKQEIKFKYSLLSLCVYSFLFIIIPIVLGFINFFSFILSIIFGLLIFAALTQWLNVKKLEFSNPHQIITLPSLIVGSALVFLYFAKILPPVPLSVQYIGIYHEVDKVTPSAENKLSQTQFILKYDRPFWKFWQNGAQDFKAEPGDKINCFARVFAPGRFKDQIVFHWLKKNPNGWQTVDKINNDISGGRDEGFRALALKSNFDAGDWRIQIETRDGREMGRIAFTVTKIKNKNLVREFNVDKF